MSTFLMMLIMLLIFGCIFVLRVLYCIKYPIKPSFTAENKKQQLCTLIVLGSGGHTSEMLTTIKNLNHCFFKPMHYIAANTDVRSLERAKRSHLDSNDVYFHSIARSREVHQSWLSTVFSTFYSLIESFFLLQIRIKPDIVICNGPGTCIPVLINALLLRAFFIKPILLIFSESFCRVNDLSMSGKIAYQFVDIFVVQWPQLIEKYPKAKYIGRIF